MMSTTEQKPPKDTSGQNVPDKEELQKSVAAAQKVVQAQSAAEALKAQAKKAFDPKERARLLKEAYDKEIEAHGQSKYAKRLQSGAWQGAAAGGGIGGGVAMGLGTVVGSLVGGVAAVPTVLLGGLTGAGVGAIKGPLIKLGGNKEGNTPMTEDEVKKQAVQEAEKLDQAVEKSANTVPQPPPDVGEDGDEVAATPTEEVPAKRRPKKLEVRSAREVTESPERRKPRKIQVRSAVESKEGA
jgi:hypothetical protein